MKPYSVAALTLLTLTGATGTVSAQSLPGQRTVTLDVRFFEGTPPGSRAKGTARLVASPRFTTLERRPASFLLAGAIPKAAPGEATSPTPADEMTFVPSRLPDGRIRLEVSYPLPNNERKRVSHAAKSGQEVKVECGKSASGEARWAVIRVEAQPGLVDRHKDLVPALLAASSRAKRKEVSEAVAEAVRALGVDAVPSLLAALDGKDRAARVLAAKLLGQAEGGAVPAEELIPALLRAARDEDPEVSAEAAIALARVVKAGR